MLISLFTIRNIPQYWFIQEISIFIVHSIDHGELVDYCPTTCQNLAGMWL